jgi:hypothetical protein
MLPAFRRMNSSPGSVCVIRFGLMREESEQVMKVLQGFSMDQCPMRAAC